MWLSSRNSHAKSHCTPVRKEAIVAGSPRPQRRRNVDGSLARSRSPAPPATRKQQGRWPRRPALACFCKSGLVLKKGLAVFLPALDPPSAGPVWENGINQPPRPGTFNCPKALGTGRLSKALASSPVLGDTAGLAAHLDGDRSSLAVGPIPHVFSSQSSRQAPVGIMFQKCTLR